MASRHRFLLFAVLGLLVALGLWQRTGKVGSRVGGAKTTLRFWHGFTSKDGETMLELVRRFNREHPDIQVEVQRIPWATYYNKLFVAGLAERAPDVFVSHAIMLARLERGGFIQPVDELMAGAAPIDASDIDPVAWRAVELDGRHLGVPLDVLPLGLYYNRTLLRTAGLVDASGEARPPRDWDEFVLAIRRLNRDDNGDGRREQWGFLFEGTPFIALYTLMLQHGGGILSADGQQARLNTPENIAALQKARWLTVDEKLVPPPGDETAWTSFLQGRVGLFLGGVFMLGGLDRQRSLDFGVAPVPQFGSAQAIWGDSHVLCLPRAQDDARRKAAWRFIRYLSDHSAEWARGGQVPVRRSQRETAAFRGLPAQTVFARSVPDVRYLPNVPSIATILRDVRFACEQVVRGAATPEEALTRAHAEVELTLERDRAQAARIRALPRKEPR